MYRIARLCLWVFLLVFVVWAFSALVPLRRAQAAEVADVNIGATRGIVPLTSATAGVRIGPQDIRTGLRVRVKEDAAIAVCFDYVDRTLSCATALTSPTTSAYCASADNGYVFLVQDEHFRGQVCAILRSAGSVDVIYNAW